MLTVERSRQVIGFVHTFERIATAVVLEGRKIGRNRTRIHMVMRSLRLEVGRIPCGVVLWRLFRFMYCIHL